MSVTIILIVLKAVDLLPNFSWWLVFMWFCIELLLQLLTEALKR